MAGQNICSELRLITSDFGELVLIERWVCQCRIILSYSKQVSIKLSSITIWLCQVSKLSSYSSYLDTMAETFV